MSRAESSGSVYLYREHQEKPGCLDCGEPTVSICCYPCLLDRYARDGDLADILILHDAKEQFPTIDWDRTIEIAAKQKAQAEDKERRKLAAAEKRRKTLAKKKAEKEKASRKEIEGKLWDA